MIHFSGNFSNRYFPEIFEIIKKVNMKQRVENSELSGIRIYLEIIIDLQKKCKKLLSVSHYNCFAPNSFALKWTSTN